MKRLVILLSVFSMLSFSAYAAKVEVEWVSPDKYSDIRNGEENRSYFRENLFYNIEKKLGKLAEKLPENQQLKVSISDVDLAGEILMNRGYLLRVIKQLYSPRIKFSYQLLDENNQVIKHGEEDFRDTNFMLHNHARYRNEQFGYEKHLLEKWFKKNLL